MDVQTLINLAFTGLLGLAGLVYKSFVKRQDEQEEMLEKLHDRIHELDKLVAGDYVKRIEIDKNIEKLFAKLDDISKAVSKKADRRIE